MKRPRIREVPGRGETRETRSDMMLPPTSVGFSLTMARLRVTDPGTGRSTNCHFILPPVCLDLFSSTLRMSFCSPALNCAARDGDSLGNLALI